MWVVYVHLYAILHIELEPVKHKSSQRFLNIDIFVITALL